MTPGKRPFIGASDNNNGITEFVSNTNESLDKNILGINYNGSVVENFYHPYEGIFSDDVKRFELNFEANKYHYLFLKNVILQQRKKYQYGYKFNAARMSKQKILLPVDENQDPDWLNIERFMKIKELQSTIDLLKFYQN